MKEIIYHSSIAVKRLLGLYTPPKQYFRLRQDEQFYFFMSKLSNLILQNIYNLEIHGKENLKNMDNKPLIPLAKHQHGIDSTLVPLAIKEATNRQMYCIIKESLPTMLEYLGGLKIIRPKEIKEAGKRNKFQQKYEDSKEKLNSFTEKKIPILNLALFYNNFFKTDFEKNKKIKEKRKNMCIKGKKIKEWLPGAIQWLIANNKVLAMFPEGERNYKKSAKIKKSYLKMIMQYNKIKPLNFVPIDIHYDNVNKIGSKIILEIKKPIQTESLEELTTYLEKNIKLLHK